MPINSLNTMIVEIVACLAVAALFGLFIGLMIRRTQMAKAESQANKRYEELKRTSLKDSKNLEDQLQTLGAELKVEKDSNKNLSSSLKDSEDSIHKARNEAVELNQTQLENNERLQAVISEKEKEIDRLTQSSLAANSNLATGAAGVAASTSLISRIPASSSDEGADSNETLDATTILTGVLHQRAIPQQGEDPGDTTVALGAGADQLRNEREALLDALAEGEQTIAISDSDLPTEVGGHRKEPDADMTNTELDETINLGRDIDGKYKANKHTRKR